MSLFIIVLSSLSHPAFLHVFPSHRPHHLIHVQTKSHSSNHFANPTFSFHLYIAFLLARALDLVVLEDKVRHEEVEEIMVLQYP